VPIGNATGASSAAPTYFDPKVQQNMYGLIEMQIDGGIICNNPALYAYNMATKLEGHKNIRVLSLGTGEKKFNSFQAQSLTRIDYMTKTDEFMMNMDTYTAHYWLQMHMPESKTNYLRL
jgi:patatin-like phospholipase/acyl hydrolase